jgi:lipopolysaccharide biosynthesis glycosyltransferase
MCILSDVSELYNTDIGGYAVGAAPDVMCYPLEKHSIEIGDLDYRKTFNAGVLVMDTEEFERQGIRDKCLELLAEDYKRKQRKLIFADQDALNIVLYDNYFVLDQKWNYQPQYLWRTQEVFEEERQKYIEDKDKACIMHFAGEKKPWQFPELPTFHTFWDYAKETSVLEVIISNILHQAREAEGRLACFDRYQFPYASVPFGSKIVIYAAGAVGKAFYNQINKTGYADLVGWVDRNYKDIESTYGVKPVNTITAMEFDYIIVAIESERIASEISGDLAGSGVPMNKIVWEKYRKVFR